MDSPPQGFALIINIQNFSCKSTRDGLQLKERKGSNVDEDNLEKVWETLGFMVEKHVNLTGHTLQICCRYGKKNLKWKRNGIVFCVA